MTNPTVATFTSDLTWGKFPEYGVHIASTFESMLEVQNQPDTAIKAAANCLREIWKNYSDEQIATIIANFAPVQKAIFGLEYNESSGKRYRDHIVHMFNVFVFGAKLLAPIAASADAERLLRDHLKVVVEPPSVAEWGWTPYTAPNRLFFLWALMSTFHDIGIPIEHLGSMREGLNDYLDYFGRRLPEFVLHNEPAVTSQLQYYFGLMGRLFDGRLDLDVDASGHYRLSQDIHPYLYKALASALSKPEPDHGVVSALCLYRAIEKTFMAKRQGYDLSLDQFKEYTRLVLEQDITRAALAISFHNIKPADYPKLFPLDFREFPLTFLLILSDELQEFLRLEGITFEGVIPLTRLPEVQVSYDEPAGRLHADVTFYYAEPSPVHWASIKRSHDEYARQRGRPPFSSFQEVVVRRWSDAVKTLVGDNQVPGKLLFGDTTPVHLQLRVDYQEASGNWQTGLDHFDSDEPPPGR